jgi:hypothetical protein
VAEESSRRSKRKPSSLKEEKTEDTSLEISSDDQKMSPPIKKQLKTPTRKTSAASSFVEEVQPTSHSSSVMISGDITNSLQTQNEELKAKLKAKKEKIAGLKKKNKTLKESLQKTLVQMAFLKGQLGDKYVDPEDK